MNGISNSDFKFEPVDDSTFIPDGLHLVLVYNEEEERGKPFYKIIEHFHGGWMLNDDGDELRVLGYAIMSNPEELAKDLKRQ